MNSDEHSEAIQLLDCVARTNIQLYNQLIAQQRSDDELRLIRNAYELAVQLYSASYQADGKPFIAHIVAVSSIVALLKLPSRMVATALIHNVYTNADFGAGPRMPITTTSRCLVKEAVGDDVEALVMKFRTMRIQHRLDELLLCLPSMSDDERLLLVLDLADHLEKCLDHGVLYYGDGRWVIDFVEQRGDKLCTLAHDLGYPVLKASLQIMFSSLAQAHVPEVLRAPAHRKYLYEQVPASYRRKTWVLVRQAIKLGPKPVAQRLYAKIKKQLST